MAGRALCKKHLYVPNVAEKEGKVNAIACPPMLAVFAHLLKA